MTSTALQIITEAYRKHNLDEVTSFSTSLEFPHNLALNILNDVIRIMNRMGNFWFCETTTSLTYSGGVYQYTMSALSIDARHIIRVRKDTTNHWGNLDPYNYEEFQKKFRREAIQTTEPTAWTRFNDTLELNTIPDQDYSIKVDHYKRIALITTTTDTTVIPEEDIDMLIQNCFLMLGVYIGKWDMAYAEKMIIANAEPFLAQTLGDTAHASTDASSFLKMPKPGDVRTFRIVAMTGGMNTVSEDNNLITLDPNSNLGAAFVQAKTEFRNIDNFRPANRGGQSKTFGTTLYKDTGTASPITGIGRFIKSDGTSLFVYSQGTKVNKLVSGTITDIGATISSGAYTWFETALDKLIICDGVNVAQTWDGTSITNIASGSDGTAATGFVQVLFYKNRVFGFSATHDPSLLYYSDGGTIGTNFATNFINCDVNDGQKITSIQRFFIPGELEPVILVGKERSVGIIRGTGTLMTPLLLSKSHRIPVFLALGRLCNSGKILHI